MNTSTLIYLFYIALISAVVTGVIRSGMIRFCPVSSLICLLFTGDDAVVADRPWDPSPPLLVPLRPGERAISEHFPVIWRRDEQPEVSVKSGSVAGAIWEAERLQL